MNDQVGIVVYPNGGGSSVISVMFNVLGIDYFNDNDLKKKFDHGSWSIYRQAWKNLQSGAK